MAASAEGSKDDTTRSKFTRPSPPRVRLHFRAGIVLTLLSIYVLLSHPLVAKRQLDHMPSIFAHLFTVLINMVNLRWGGLAARALHFMSTNRQPRDYTPATYAEKTLIAAKALQGWYDRPFGLWNTTGWWNSANCLTILTDWASLAKADADSINIADIIATTYMNAQSRTVTAIKTLSATGEITSTYTYGPSSIAKRGYPEFLNDYYDDEGWWALALIRSWDVTKQKAYLDTAERIFRDMQNGTDNVCGGGIWWSKERKYKNAIANELYLSVAASLANRIEGSKEYYLQIAKDSWGWFKRSGMINSDNLINDGLNIRADGTCVNNGLQTWSYNQGVVLGGLVELRRATGDKTFLDEAVRISEAAIRRLKDENGTIREIDRCEPNCGNDGLQFKGIFVRNLKYLHDWAPKDLFKETITSNADSIWEKNRNVNNQFGISWSGPPEAGKGPTAGTHSSAMDVLVAALSL